MNTLLAQVIFHQYKSRLLVFLLAVGILSSPVQFVSADETITQESSQNQRAAPSYEGQRTAVGITANGNAVVAYYDIINKDLVLSVYPLSDPTRSQKKILDSVSDVGKFVSLWVVSNTDVVVSYMDEVSGDLKVARCSIPCTTPSVVSIVSTHPLADSFGVSTSITVNSLGYPVIAHTDTESRILFLTICKNTTCSSSTTTTPVETLGGPSNPKLSLALTSAGYPVIAYPEARNGDSSTQALKLLRCNNAACSTSTQTYIESAGNTGYGLDMKLGSADEPHISYYEYGSKVLKYARCSTATCSTIVIKNLQSTGVSPSDTAINFHINSRFRPQPVISVWNWVLGSSTIKTVSCSTVDCISPSVASISSSDTGYGLSMSIIGDWTVVGYYYLDGDVYTYNDPTYPVGTASSASTALLHVGVAPGSFSKSAPATNTEVNRGSTVNLSWENPATSTSFAYCFYLSSARCTSWRTVYGSNVRVVATTPGIYYWQVRAANRAGTTYANGGTPWVIRVRTPTVTPSAPKPFVRTSPANNAVRVPLTANFSWQSSVAATSYEYCISPTTTCTFWTNVGNTRSVVPTSLARNKTYYWSVRAKNSTGVTPASGGMWKFTTAP